MSKLYLGIDLGGTEVKVAVVNSGGDILEESRIPNSMVSVPEEICAQIIEHARAMKNFKKLSGTGIGVAGDIDQERGVVRFSPNLPGWKNADLRKILGNALPKPIVVDNDANAAALGAYWLDAKGKIQNLICITLGTGVGGGLICEGKLFRGATGSAGEIGHMPLEPNGPICKCGSRGCIERYLGAAALSCQAREAVKMGKSKIIYKLVSGNLNEITPQVLTAAAHKGDSLAKTIWQEAGERLGIVLAGVINLLNPEMIVLAGGVSRAGELILKPLKETVKERAFITPAKACRVVISRYTQKLGVVGAALLAKK
ncbi:MAG: ROK family protein [Endomicrobiales bacterium]